MSPQGPALESRASSAMWKACVLICALVCGCTTESSNERPEQSDETIRIVSLTPAGSVMLAAAGLEANVVGRHGWDTVLSRSLPVAGDQTGLDYERLIGLDPTHVLIEWGARAPPARLTRLAEEREWSLIPIETLTLDDIARSAERVMALPGAAQQTLTTSIDRLRSQHGKRDAAGTVLMVVSTSPTVDCLGPGSAHHQVLERAGFRSALQEGGPWMSLSIEDVIELDPWAIVLVQPSASPDASSGSIEDRLGPLASQPLSAVAAGRIAVIDDPQALIPSLNLAGLSDDLIRTLSAMHPLPSASSAASPPNGRTNTRGQ